MCTVVSRAQPGVCMRSVLHSVILPSISVNNRVSIVYNRVVSAVLRVLAGGIRDASVVILVVFVIVRVLL